MMGEKQFYICEGEDNIRGNFGEVDKALNNTEIVDLLNEQQELIEELQTSDEMGWKRAERFEKKCPKELHNKKMYIKRLEYKVQKFKEENEQLRQQIQNYEQLLANSYVGIEETLDGFIGKYVIWEDELQKCKNKNEMIE